MRSSVPAPPPGGKTGPRVSLDTHTTPGPRLYLPATFDARAVPGLPPGWRQYAEWCVSAVVCRQLRDRLTPADPVPLANEYLRRHLSRPAVKPVPRLLVAAGVLATDWAFTRGTAEGPGRCRLFALGPAFHAAPLRPVPVTHPELVRTMTAARVAAEADAVAADPPTMRALREHLNAVTVTGRPAGTDPALDALAAGDPWFVRCDYGRVHTPVTSLARTSRPLVRLAGEEPACVDVSQSQPWLLAALLGCRRPAADPPREGTPAAPPAPPPAHQPPRSGRPPLFGNSSDAGPNDDYAADLDADRMYDRLAGPAGYTRDGVKPKFLAVVYGRPEDSGTRAGRAFREAYPETFAAAMAYKRTHDPAELARELQRQESAVMIGAAAGRLVRDRPAMPFLTVHDAVLCRPGDAAFVADVIRTAWLDRYGAAPRLKTKPWAG